MSVMTTRVVIFRLVMTRSYICSMYIGPTKASIFIKKLNITAVKNPDLVARKASESRFVFAICAATAGLSSESPTYRALHSAVRASPSNATIRKRDPGNRYGNVTVEWEGMYAAQPAQGKMRNYHASHLLSRLIRCRASAGHQV